MQVCEESKEEIEELYQSLKNAFLERVDPKKCMLFSETDIEYGPYSGFKYNNYTFAYCIYNNAEFINRLGDELNVVFMASHQNFAISVPMDALMSAKKLIVSVSKDLEIEAKHVIGRHGINIKQIIRDVNSFRNSSGEWRTTTIYNSDSIKSKTEDGKKYPELLNISVNVEKK